MKRIPALIIATALTCGVAVAQTTSLAPRGALVEGELQQTLDTGKLHDGERFTLLARDTLWHHTALKGDVIDGHVANVVPASATHKASLSIILDDVRTPDGTLLPIDAHVTSLKEFAPKSHLFRDTALVIGGAVTGHIVSKKTGHGGGTLAGAAGGFALASSLKSNVVVRKGSIVQLRLIQAVPAQAGA